MSAKALPVLMYHHVSPEPGLVTISPQHFRAQMHAVARAGYQSVTAQQLQQFLAGGKLPAKSVLITFDDGYLDNWVYAHPVLKETGLSATLFTITGWIGDGPMRPYAGQQADLPITPSHKVCMNAVREQRHDDVMMRWSEIEAAQRAGTFEFHSHTHTHTRWDKLFPVVAERRQRLAEDLALSRETLNARLGYVSRHLCWPQGYFDTDYIAEAQAAGFDHLYTTQPGTVLPQGDSLRLPRIVTKDKPARWLLNRLWLYRSPTLSRLYSQRKRVSV